MDEFDYEIGDLQGSESLGKIDWDELKTIANRNELDHSSKIGQAVAYTLLLLLLGIIAFLFFANTKPVNKQTNKQTNKRNRLLLKTMYSEKFKRKKQLK